MKLNSWIRSSFSVTNILGGVEYQFNCPRCGHESFYFNVLRRVGFCHRASCHYTPSLEELVAFIGHGPDEDDVSWFQDEDPPKEEKEVSLPSLAVPILYRVPDRRLFTNYTDLVSLLKVNRSIEPKDIFKWDLHTDGRRIYVPVYDDGRMVSYVSRIIWGLDPMGEKKYKYPSGTNVANYLFGWTEAKYWDHLVLVENTFNSIAYRDLFNCTTNFGSYLSKVQARKILMAPNIKSVVFLWDGDAHERAGIAAKYLRNNGIKTTYCVFEGQPDNYATDVLQLWVGEARKKALMEKSLDIKLECEG